MWMQFDVFGNFEIFDCDRNGFLKCVIVFVWDFCILGFIFLKFFYILGKFLLSLDVFKCEFNLVLRDLIIFVWD